MYDNAKRNNKEKNEGFIYVLKIFYTYFCIFMFRTYIFIFVYTLCTLCIFFYFYTINSWKYDKRINT